MFEVPVAFLHERLICAADTGELFWKAAPSLGKTWNARYAGKPAGTHLGRGYIGVTLFFEGEKRVFKAHRIVFAMTHGRWPEKLDHVNRRGGDNRPSNLRETTHRQNMQNVDRRGTQRLRASYRARIAVNGKQTHLGCFPTEEEAREAYLEAKKSLHPFYTVGG